MESKASFPKSIKCVLSRIISYRKCFPTTNYFILRIKQPLSHSIMVHFYFLMIFPQIKSYWFIKCHKNWRNVNIYIYIYWGKRHLIGSKQSPITSCIRRAPGIHMGRGEALRSLPRSHCGPSQSSLWTSKVLRGECSDNRLSESMRRERSPASVCH